MYPINCAQSFGFFCYVINFKQIHIIDLLCRGCSTGTGSGRETAVKDMGKITRTEPQQSTGKCYQCTYRCLMVYWLFTVNAFIFDREIFMYYYFLPTEYTLFELKNTR